MSVYRHSVAALMVSLLAAPTAGAWGPTTQASIVTTAVHVLSQNIKVPLVRYQEYFRAGASISDQEQREYYPAFHIDPVTTIANEMYLLQSVRSMDRVDPYFAYRLGTLGKIVVQAVAPMRTDDPALRERYYADVESHIDGVSMQSSDRMLVDPPAYFDRIQSQANANNATIAVDYRSGLGFRGFARAALPSDASRAVDAVADVWYTIFLSQSSVANVSQAEIRGYVLNGVEFYLEREKIQESRELYNLAQEKGAMTADLRKQIADAYFDAARYEIAMEEYAKVLAQSPGRRDVMQRIAEYYERVGDLALAEDRLEDAQEAYAEAVNADNLHPEAQRKLLRVEDLIFERDARLEKQRNALLAAREQENRAKVEAQRGNFAQALVHLRRADELYGSVSEEFAEEARAAEIGQRNVQAQRQEYNSQLIANAQSFSGTGYAFEARQIADSLPGGADAALRDLLRSEYEAALQALRNRMQNQPPSSR